MYSFKTIMRMAALFTAITTKAKTLVVHYSFPPSDKQVLQCHLALYHIRLRIPLQSVRSDHGEMEGF